jgi:uncharacterized membrane protein YbaN (DUF454 family)
MVVSGVFFVGLAAVGAFLPGIPTVGPLLLGSYLLTKSFPALEQRLVRNHFFARYLHYLDGSSVMPTKTRISSIVLMWCSIAFSISLIYWTSGGPLWLMVLIAIAGVVGTVFIWQFRRGD